MIIKKQLGAFASIAVLLSVTACSSTGSVNNDADAAQQLSEQQAQLAAREADLKRREMALSNAKAAPAPAPVVVAGGAGSELLPPQAKAGQCFTRVWEPATYRTVSNKRLVSEAGERIEVIPAKYRTTTKRVIVKEASTKLVAVPATYKTETKRVMVNPARTITETVPPVYETVSEKVLDKPAHTVWKKGSGPIQRIDTSTGEIMCLVEVPASYKTVTKRVLKTPAKTRTREIPAEYRTVKQQVLVNPANTRTIEIPAEYSTVKVTEEATPAQERRIAIPEKYATVDSRELVKDGQMAWREILCETNTTPDRVAKIQSALKQAGHNPGPIDGNIGPSTIRAVNAFQRSKGLPVDKYLNIATVRALGVSTK